MKIDFQRVRKSPEFTSAVIRVGIWMVVTGFIGIAMWQDYYVEAWNFFFVFSAAFLTYTLIVLISILFYPRVRWRPYVTIPFDVASISAAMLITDDGPFSPFFLLYPWYFVSYGLRYGRGVLFTTAITSILAFSILLYLTDTWYSHTYDVIAYLIFLAVLPIYINIMLARINRARDEANAANKAKSEFLAAMSHEVRTPMSGIVGVSNLLEKTELDDDQREYVEALQQSSAALNAIIDDVLDLSKIEAGKYRLETERFSLPDVLYGVAQMFTPSANNKGLDLFCYYDPALPEYMYGDSKRLRQIMLNLISNAVKFTSHGDVCIFVTAAQEQPADDRLRVRIEVRDTGPGLSEADVRRIFEPFYQAEEQSRQNTGTGLGTTISMNLVKLMGGNIGVNSEVGTGSTFWLEIDWRFEPPQPIARTEQRYPVLLLETHSNQRFILDRYGKALGWHGRCVDNSEALNSLVESYLDEEHADRVLVFLSELTCGEDCSAIARDVRDRFGERVRICRIIHLEQLNQLSAEESKWFDQHLIMPVSIQRLNDTLLLMSDQTPEGPDLTQAVAENKIQQFMDILIAEDSPINAKVILTFLKQDGHRVDHAEDGEQALAALRQKHYDLVLMDMRMPGLDGIETTRQWRKEELDGQHVPIVALTANATTEDKTRCLEAGMDDFLSKPVNQEQLRQLIQQLPSQLTVA